MAAKNVPLELLLKMRVGPCQDSTWQQHWYRSVHDVRHATVSFAVIHGHLNIIHQRHRPRNTLASHAASFVASAGSQRRKLWVALVTMICLNIFYVLSFYSLFCYLFMKPPQHQRRTQHTRMQAAFSMPIAQPRAASYSKARACPGCCVHDHVPNGLSSGSWHPHPPCSPWGNGTSCVPKYLSHQYLQFSSCFECQSKSFMQCNLRACEQSKELQFMF